MNIQNLELKRSFTGIPEGNWADQLAGQTYGSASGSALKSMRQRLCFAAGLAGSDTSWLPPTGAVLPHSVDPVSVASLCDAQDPAFQA